MPRPRLATILTALALAAPAAAPAAPIRPLADFDVRKVEGLADRLALCDLTAFLITRPNLQADVIIAPNRGGAPARVMRQPYYRPLTGLFDEDLDDAMRVMEAHHQVTRREVAAARTRYDVQMLRSYERSSMPQRRFLDEQAKRCSDMFNPRR